MDRRNKKLKISYWSADGIKNKKYELAHYLIEQQIDVMLLEETRLRGEDRLNILNYITYRTSRQNQPKGGTAICIKKYIPHHLVQRANSNIENTIITVLNRIEYIIIAAYCSPNYNITKEEIEVIF